MMHGDNLSPGHATAPEQVYDKHCVPDSVQQDNHSVPLIALPNNARLSVIDWHDAPRLQDIAWLMPPIAGPLAEERFCRYRK